MIIQKEIDNMIYTYSDIHHYIQNNNGEIFEEAYDPIEFKDQRKYIETDQEIENIDDEEIE